MEDVGKLPFSLRSDCLAENLEQKLEKLSNRIRVAIPGIIQSFDENTQTVNVQPVIRERSSFAGAPFENKTLPILKSVPIFALRAGDFVITIPIQPGDECLLIFCALDRDWET